MKKTLLSGFFLFFLCVTKAQENVGLFASANFDFAVKGLGLNDAGLGATVQANFFNQRRVRLRTEAGVDYFVGDKLLFVDANGETVSRNPTLFSGRVGLDISAYRSFSVAALYGFTAYNWEREFITAGQLKLSVASSFGKQKRGLFAFSFQTLPGEEPAVQFFTFSTGYRIL